jgi:hypothetical protein
MPYLRCGGRAVLSGYDRPATAVAVLFVGSGQAPGTFQTAVGAALGDGHSCSANHFVPCGFTLRRRSSPRGHGLGVTCGRSRPLSGANRARNPEQPPSGKKGSAAAPVGVRPADCQQGDCWGTSNSAFRIKVVPRTPDSRSPALAQLPNNVDKEANRLRANMLYAASAMQHPPKGLLDGFGRGGGKLESVAVHALDRYFMLSCCKFHGLPV